ncbi:hypothetical protein [Nocardia aurea]|uniref:hypothetical protein n=1 Tax=Nocardia aurea TaxID=2144174 RepID=UPI00130037B0|nr:hypothetical protein [Nocardia aurea]
MSDETVGFLVAVFEEPDEAGPGAIRSFHERWQDVHPTIEGAQEELAEARLKEPADAWEIFALARVGENPTRL